MSNSLLAPILDDDAITRGLGDAEARILIEWLVERAEEVENENLVEEQSQATVKRLCRRARSISRFVSLWEKEQRAAAYQLAASERFSWPLPADSMDPCDLMQTILSWEGRTLP
jgi:hypothetical protein